MFFTFASADPAGDAAAKAIRDAKIKMCAPGASKDAKPGICHQPNSGELCHYTCKTERHYIRGKCLKSKKTGNTICICYPCPIYQS
ncbi:hypothetical protein AALP_AA3G344700 [Arabis alpina]|uniref:Uncharacterized protein n=1 Tax=Arabis alpina TaxID=50452 RepID=A0A087HDK8_ARAAL|nr:hypothetical protein AALP_AA3G344700 [Arabis alpina]